MSNIPSTVWGLFKSALESIGNGIVNLYEFVKSLPSGVWNLFQAALENITNNIISIYNFFNGFFEEMLIFIKNIFVPKDDYFNNNFNSINETFNSKFKFISQIDEVFSYLSVSTFSEEVYSINFPKYNIEINFEWYEPYRDNFKNILMGAFTLMFIGAIVKRNDPRINLGGN